MDTYYMKLEKKFAQIQDEIAGCKNYEFIFIAAALIAGITMHVIIPSNHKVELDLLLIGFVHIISRNALSFLYNLNWVILPAGQKVSPGMLMLIGLATSLAGIVAFIISIARKIVA